MNENDELYDYDELVNYFNNKRISITDDRSCCMHEYDGINYGMPKYNDINYGIQDHDVELLNFIFYLQAKNLSITGELANHGNEILNSFLNSYAKRISITEDRSCCMDEHDELLNYYNNFYNKGISLTDDRSYDNLKQKIMKSLKLTESELYKRFENKLDTTKYVVEDDQHKSLHKNLIMEKGKLKKFYIDDINLGKYINNIYKSIGDNVKLEFTPKIDGVCCFAVYENKKLCSLYTKGNSGKLNNISHIRYFIEDIPEKCDINIDTPFTIMFELYLPKSSNNDVHTRRGVVSAINSKNYNGERLKSYYIDTQNINYYDFLPKVKKQILLTKDNFNLTCDESIKSIQDKLYLYLDFLHTNYNDLPIDGVCVNISGGSLKSNFIQNRFLVKLTNKIVSTTIENIEYKTGKTGKITPIAKITQINLEDTKVNYINLYSVKYIKKHNLKIGSVINITLKGNCVPIIVF